MKKILALFLIFCLLILSASCENQSKTLQNTNDSYEHLEDNKDIFKYIPQDQKNIYKHKEKVDLFDSEISVGYKNEDGTYTAYIFSSPIRYKEGVDNLIDIDNRLIKITGGKYYEKGYRYRNNKNNILTYFPQFMEDDNGFLIESYYYDIKFGFTGKKLNFKKLENEPNLLGIKNDTLIYTDNNNLLYKVYSTKAGIQTDLEFSAMPENKSISVWFEASGLNVSLERGGYVVFKDKENTVQGIIRPPIVKSMSDKTLYLDNILKLKKNKNQYLLTILLDDKLPQTLHSAVTLSMPFEMHRSKLPDSAIYSKRKYINQYLSDISVVGKHPDWGMGKIYSRLRLQDLLYKNKNIILSANYAVFNITESKFQKEIYLNKVNQFWSSTQINWNTKVQAKYKLSTQKIKKEGYYYFDITKLVKTLKQNETVDTDGIVLESNDEYTVFATSDNAQVPVFIQINFSELPKSFVLK